MNMFSPGSPTKSKWDSPRMEEPVSPETVLTPPIKVRATANRTRAMPVTCGQMDSSMRFLAAIGRSEVARQNDLKSSAICGLIGTLDLLEFCEVKETAMNTSSTSALD